MEWYMKYWGKHQVINAHKCGILHINNYKSIYAFNQKLLQAIDMKPYGKPFIERFGEGHLKGYTLIQAIHTSSITFHFAEESGDVYGDVFSCKWFDEKVVEAVIQNQFNPVYIDSKVLHRQGGILM
jgi:S-adenosylmethionine/arginine decarboxylase-like enzyme